METKLNPRLKVVLAAFFLTFFISISSHAQDRIIRGKVTAAENGSALAGVAVVWQDSKYHTTTDKAGGYSITVPSGDGILQFTFPGFRTVKIKVGIRNTIDVVMSLDARKLKEDTKAAGAADKRVSYSYAPSTVMFESEELRAEPFNTEAYDAIHENIFHGAMQNPLSTFSIDVDAASYSNMRRFIQDGQRPPVDAVRIEEMINYFDYTYRQPENQDPFSVYTEISAAPWNEKHKLVHIGLQGRIIPTANLPASNLVFLIDVSGSMNAPNKLPLLKSSLKMLVEQLRSQDHVSIVVYAGAAGLVLPPTSGEHKKTIIESLDNLQAGGSTAGGAGIQLAYAVAKENFVAGGNNRVILATDGDFNIGESSNASMERLIEEKRENGIFLTVLGYGMGNYKDSKMEILADKGNGNYAYIDNILEARKVLVSEFGGTLFTIAKDVKLQVEFNPAKVKAYRLIGYENRMLKSEDFNNDKKDAGDLGSGHTVTALYEIIPVGVESEFYKIDPLKYQKNELTADGNHSSELMTIKLRYKEPAGNTSKLIVHTLADKQQSLASSSEDFRWSASVAAFGMILRNSEFVKGYGYREVQLLAEGARGKDKEGYRAEFINMVKSMELLAGQ